MLIGSFSQKGVHRFDIQAEVKFVQFVLKQNCISIYDKENQLKVVKVNMIKFLVSLEPSKTSFFLNDHLISLIICRTAACFLFERGVCPKYLHILL